MNIFITGIRGFLGSRLERELLAAGHSVAGSTSAHDPRRPKLPVIRVGDQPDPNIFGHAEVVVHGAHDFTPGGLDRNVTGAAALYRAATPRRQVFISSCAARPDAASDYGIAKFRIESFFLERGETIVRPGLVVGPGGLFGKQLQFLTRSPLIPLLDNGRAPVPVISIDDYCAAMLRIIASPKRGASEFNLFNPVVPSMREVVDAVLRASGHWAVIAPVGSGVAEKVLALAERLRIPLPVTRDNLRGVRLQTRCIYASDLPLLVPCPASLDAMVRTALRSR